MNGRANDMHIPDYEDMKRMLDYLKISYWLIDFNFVLMDVNETFLELTGAQREKLIGRDMLTLVKPEEAEFIKDAVDKLHKNESAIQYEFYVYGRKDKVKIPVLFHTTVNRDGSGRPVSFNMLLSDISAQKSLEERERELFHVRRSMRQQSLQTQMIGTGKAMQTVFYTLLRCAEVDSPVLITGETGVGKEVAARAIHGQSSRRQKPFVAVNCGALPGDLLESELFGHVRGAFTGAVSNRPGLFREAEGGVLFLDEIGDMEKRLQVKLLRVLQENEIRPVGDDRSYPVDLRIICATNQNLRQRAEEGVFRLDLYYRISVIPIDIPPLRDRPEDIIKLAEQFIRKQPKHKRFTEISPEAHKQLYSYHWPGNIRELQNAIEHALAMSRGKTLLPESLPDQIKQQSVQATGLHGHLCTPPASQSKAMRIESEKRAIMEALDLHRGNQSAAAKALGISRVTLWRKKTMYQLA